MFVAVKLIRNQSGGEEASSASGQSGLEHVMRRYGAEEYRFARPIADGLVFNPAFRVWLLKKTRFAPHAEVAELQHKEQKARRTPQAENWWRSYWTTNKSCSCGACGERETDLLAVFATPDDFRFALHIEVKSPNDKLGLNQARDYIARRDCWAGRARAPKTVLPHDEATTVLACEAQFAVLNQSQTAFFDAMVTFEEVAHWLSPFPDSA